MTGGVGGSSRLAKNMVIEGSEAFFKTVKPSNLNKMRWKRHCKVQLYS